MMRVLVTGAHGFLGSHFRIAARREERIELEALPREELYDPSELRSAAERSDVILHLAGLNRAPEHELLSVNVDLAQRVAEACAGLPVHVIFSSSTQRELDNAYGRSKLAAEETLDEGSRSAGYTLTVAELTNVFGPGCPPFYNSVVATFAHELASGRTPTVDVDREMELLWVDDLARSLVSHCLAPAATNERLRPRGDSISVSSLLDTLTRFRQQHFDDHVTPHAKGDLEANLYRTLVSYTPDGGHAYQPTLHADARGSLFEVSRQAWAGGQSFFSLTRPGVVRGQHYHTRKFEKFCVVRGEGVIRLRRLLSDDVQEYRVSGDRPTVVDIPIFQVHNIENVGSKDMLTLFWASEVFDPFDPDTIAEDV
jgi:UDP-2-acetamido-2,6-beta-L-arabino-hexul-4-ose reductase